jgi:IS30 family transposase
MKAFIVMSGLISKQGGDLYTYLRRQGKKCDKCRNGKSTRGPIKNRVSIDERSQIVDDNVDLEWSCH